MIIKSINKSIDERFCYSDCVEKIHFFKDGEVIASFNQGCFYPMEIPSNSSEKISHSKKYKYINTIMLGEIKKANKINLNHKYSFYTKSNSKDYFHKAYDVYINCGDCGDATIECLGEYIKFENGGECCYKKLYEITLKNGALLLTDKELEYNRRFVIETGEYTRTEKTAKRVALDNIASIMSNVLGKHICWFEVEKLEKSLSIKIKDAYD